MFVVVRQRNRQWAGATEVTLRIDNCRPPEAAREGRSRERVRALVEADEVAGAGRR